MLYAIFYGFLISVLVPGISVQLFFKKNQKNTKLRYRSSPVKDAFKKGWSNTVPYTKLSKKIFIHTKILLKDLAWRSTSKLLFKYCIQICMTNANL
jgi:hypothetical protein